MRADFPPGAGIAKGAAASPLCTFARNERPYKGNIMANGTCSRPWYISPVTGVLYMLDGGCAALTRPTILGCTLDVGWVSAAHPP
ncbi:hypothetical protein AGJ32_01380 [Cronobacter turicensis]|nr:hypothetical protein [Cronobacter turicensis]EGT5738805.1 hypothetical protein [Cronobacter turicensis]